MSEHKNKNVSMQINKNVTINNQREKNPRIIRQNI